MGEHFTLETAGASAALVGRDHGLAPEDLEAAGAAAERAGRFLVEARAAGRAGFLDLPVRGDLAVASAAAAEALRSRADVLVVAGMGGSALGARALLGALGNPLPPGIPGPGARRGMRVLVLDTVDPAAVVPLLEALPADRTAWDFVSKSGSTLEPMALYALVRHRLQAALGPAWRERVVVTTEPGEGPLRKEADRERLQVLEVPPEAGGRFSVLSPVGLLPAAAAGIDVEAVLRGASAAAAGFDHADPDRNDALRLALWLALLGKSKGKRHHVLVACAEGLAALAAWWQQLWAESLGKDGKGFDATPAVAPACHHSLLQIWMQGPRDKAFVYLEVEDPGADRVMEAPGPPGAPHAVRRTIGDVHRALLDGARAGLVAAGRPVLRIRIPALRPEPVGAVLQLWMTAAALAGPLLGVDPFGQPGVEEGKRNAAALLGREDEAERRAKVRDLLERLQAPR